MDALSASIWVALASAVLGGILAVLRPFLVREDEIETRIALHRRALLEKVAQRHTSALTQILHVDDDTGLRGKAPTLPDVVGDYTDELVRTLGVLTVLGQLRKRVRGSYSALLLSIGFSLLGLLSALVLPSSRGIVLGFSTTLVFAQFGLACVIRHSDSRLRTYEETT